MLRYTKHRPSMVTLYVALQEMEGALEAEESKVTRAQLELTQYKQEAEKRIADKDEELDNLRYEDTLKTHLYIVCGLARCVMVNALDSRSSGGLEILLASSCLGNPDMLRPDGPRTWFERRLYLNRFEAFTYVCVYTLHFFFTGRTTPANWRVYKLPWKPR